jgi:hypothetical protein
MSSLRIVMVATMVALFGGAQSAHAIGALAIDHNQGPNYGFSYDHPNEQSARAAAVKACGANCKSIVVFRNTCSAFAADQIKGSTVYGWAYAPTSQAAQQSAMRFCQQYGGKKCLVRVWACESTRNAQGIARYEASAEASGTAVTSRQSAPPPQVAPPPPPQVAPAPPPPAPPPQSAAVVPVAPPPPVVPQSAEATNRVALVIGNDRYDNLDPLQKAVNDARAVGNVLTRMGFQVIRVENAQRRLMNQKLVEFTGKVGRGDTALFFFAGHGVEIRGTNYLLPTDTPQVREGEEGIVTSEGIPADNIVERLQERGAKITMMVLDACRENPFRKAGTRGIGATRGLAQMIAPEGVFVLYSAGLGQTALDRLSNSDPNPNSVFTRTFVQAIAKPGLSVQDVAKATQLEVRRLAGTVNHPQMPAYYDQILGEFTLLPSR